MIFTLAKSLLRGSAVTALMALLISLFFFSIDFVEFARTGFDSSNSSNRGLKEYARRVSLYSLVKLSVLEVAADGNLAIDRSDELFSCVGNLRRSYPNSFVDMTSLTISIVGIENYNRNYLRRTIEYIGQDTLRKFGFDADFTIGIAQIKTSLAEKIYKAKIDSSAPKTEITNYVRSDCGSVRLAAFHVESLASECIVENKNADLASIIECVVTKYTGMKPEKREQGIYTAAVGHSYNLLFNITNEFYYTDYVTRLKINAVRSGECIQFNAGTAQLFAAPKDQAARVDYLGPQKSNPVDHVVIDGERIEFSRNPVDEPQGIVKIITPERDTGIYQTNPKLSEGRRKVIVQFVCAKYKPIAIDFYPRPDYVPGTLSKYCTGTETTEPSFNSYVLLNVAGSVGPDVRTELCK